MIASNGKPISDGVHTVTIAFYDSLSGGAALYNETQTTRTINGVYSIVIGSVTPIAPSLDFRKQYFLGMTIDGGSELSPRTQLTSVPYSLNSASADLAKDVSPDAKGIVTSINEVSGTLRIVGDSTVSVTQSGQTISLHSFVVGSGGSGGIQSLQSPQKTILLTYPNGPLASLDVRDSSISSQKIADGAVTMSKLNSSNASSGQVIKWNGSAWAPANEGGGSSGVQWLLSGNAGTTAGTNYIGTNDNQALDFRTNGSIVLRLNTNNSIQRDAVANVRGARAIDMQLTRSSTLQVASGDGSVISGGDYNTSSGTNSVVGGGVTNTASNSYTTVAGGGNNSATDAFATVSGGGHNTASGSYSSIGGGESNNTSGSSSTIAGGVSDTAAGYVASVGGGIYNYARGTGSVIGGGNSNNVDSGYYGVIGGGWANDIKKNNDVSTIAGGAFNTINATSSSIGGG
ncbi:MAG TPA: hypothetical protein VEW28_03685, partial [Candidatus Kapabacteria bacterium]|nr:hypothetical protein [Candidatus Kapabacteria bacterium]